VADLAGRIAWITGAGSGIGRAIAISFARQGARLALTGRRAAALEETARLTGTDALVVPADLTDDAAITAAHATVAAKLGSPDILVNNAGANTPRRYLHQLNAAAARSLIDANLTQAMLTSMAVLPGMRARGGGTIVQVASMAGKVVSFLSGPGYTAAKHGLVALSQAINQEQGIHNIRSCCICPGEVATDILKARPEPVPEEDVARLLQPEDLARIALFLVTLPPHVCIAELQVTPTYQRLLAEQARRIAATP
jgi:NADP-dependent 3-hydroxy acid dehydrogenase YdfG